MDDIRALIERAISIAGSQAKLADACGVKQASIWQAKDAGRVSAELAIGMHRATAGEVSCRALRPDLDWDAIAEDRPAVA
jgi:DNA-binding transcriptional regulator YdaS (Cro superfamily)